MSEPEAWFFYCWRPGKHCWWASVDKDDKDWWPTDDWKVVRRIALTKSGEWETLHGNASDLPKAIRTQSDRPVDCRTIAGRGVCDMCAQGDYEKCRYVADAGEKQA